MFNLRLLFSGKESMQTSGMFSKYRDQICELWLETLKLNEENKNLKARIAKLEIVLNSLSLYCAEENNK